MSVSGKHVHRHQLKIRYGPVFHIVTLCAPTSAVYETWWSLLENALACTNFAVPPVIDARARQVNIAPVLPSRRNITQRKHRPTLETVMEGTRAEKLMDGIPMLEVGGPSSPTETDILASWRTWASLDYFATPPSITGPLSSSEAREAAANGLNDSTKDDDTNSDRRSVYSDISEFWSRLSEWDDEIPFYLHPTPVTSIAVCGSKSHDPQRCIALQPQDDDEKWLDEIALFAFRQKVGATRKLERRPTRHITERLHPLLNATHALF
ncbi:hypothetical protein GN244_ATG05967 [Phytophthora infestans]|uniref:Uncharacterized protein n=1 Tax=Phytophthora infestans TaxID=4787 RepID=A0A833T198_PHYIN|nr:hypothetical protein GN244_ATG05967 [Phytophthora infestans]KAF4149096.1 hypothetical protein GN958_ATG01724 [Phytophthora infestans]